MTIHDDAFGCGTADPSNPGGGPVQFAEARLRPHSGRGKASGGAAAAIDLLREQLIALLEGHGAHMPFEAAVAELPADAINQEPPNVPYTPWHLVEHIRRTQQDIVEYIRDPAHQSPPWPAGYWPNRGASTDATGFAASVEGYRRSLAELVAIVRDPLVDLFAVLPGTPGHTVLREARLAGDHTAYHVGEFAILRQVMDTWPADRRG
jgi:DinB superfamily